MAQRRTARNQRYPIAQRRTAPNQRYLIHGRSRKVTLFSQNPTSAFASLQPRTSFKTPPTAIIPNPSEYQGSITQPSGPEVLLKAIFEAGTVELFPQKYQRIFSKGPLVANIGR